MNHSDPNVPACRRCLGSALRVAVAAGVMAVGCVLAGPTFAQGAVTPAIPAAPAAPPVAAAAAASAGGQTDYSPAEKALFMRNQLGPLKLPATLRYTFRKSGSLEEPFEDRVSLAVRAMPGGACCSGSSEFLSGARKIVLPDVEGAEGNPVLMYFLERDVREMQRLTKGSQSHFRKRIRMAIYGGAAMRDVAMRYRGRDIPGQEVLIAPFLDDPNRPRYEQLARKEYRFLLSTSVPGGIVGIRTRVAAEAAGAAPLLAEEMLIEGAAWPVPAS